MKSLEEVTRTILTQPTPQALVDLQGALLAAQDRDVAGTDAALDLAGHFYGYLSDLRSKITAREYSELASRLDIAAVGFVALENIVATGTEDFWKRLILGGIGEGMMVMASRQYVRAWQVETSLVHSQAAWYLTGALWQVSRRMVPDLEPDQRWLAIHALLAPVHEAEVPAPDKAVLLGRIFQLLLLTHLAHLLPGS